jgi:hypothetical protein
MQADADWANGSDGGDSNGGDANGVGANGARSRFDLAGLPGQTRAVQIAATLDRAFADSGFRGHVQCADAARDSGDWPLAEREYGRALRLFPLHWGYCIQFGHSAKEQSLFARAEAWYRSAVALAAPPDMVDEHLIFVARASGATFTRQGMPDLDVAPLRAPPTIADIRLLADLLGVPRLADEEQALDLMRSAPDNRAVLLALIERPEFVRANRQFLEILHG